eukprot:scaffold113971_cov57-Phaeocystis_antarctica.AAC.2
MLRQSRGNTLHSQVRHDARHERGPRRRTPRSCVVTVQRRSLSRQSVHGRRDHSLVVVADIGPALVVDEPQDDVRLRWP